MSPSILGPLPENVLKCISPQDRKPLGRSGLTMQEIDAKADRRREKELQQAVASILRLRNYWFDVTRMDRKTTGQVGRPDFLVCVKGKFVAVEVKARGGKLSSDQVQVLARIEQAGGIVRVVRNERELVEFLNELEGE